MIGGGPEMAPRPMSVRTLPDLRLGQHICWAFEDDTGYLAVVDRYVADGLRDGQRVACFVSRDKVDAFVRHLHGMPCRIAESLDTGALMVGCFEDAYVEGGRFDVDRRLSGYEQMVRDAIADGYTGLRVMGEATAMLQDGGIRRAWSTYELRADLLAARLPLIALCGYDVGACDPEGLAVLRAFHTGSFGRCVGACSFHVHGTADGALAVAGEIDFACSSTVADVTVGAVPDLAAPVLDLSRLRFVDVSGMRAVVAVIEAMAAGPRHVRVRGAGPVFRRMWDILGLHRELDVDLEAA